VIRPPHRVGRLLAALVLTGALAACAVDGEHGDGSDRQASSGGERGQRHATRSPGAADMQPEQLLGLTPDELSGLLGPADFTRDDGPAEIWQFRDAECVLDVYLYIDPIAGGYRVEHVEARDGSLVNAADTDCVAGLMQDRRLRASG
jgi:hypothetical protein